MRKRNVFRVSLFAIFFLIIDRFQASLTLCQSMQCSIPDRKTYNPIWPVSPSSRDMFLKVFASQVFDVIAFCSVLIPSTVGTNFLPGSLNNVPDRYPCKLLEVFLWHYS